MKAKEKFPGTVTMTFTCPCGEALVVPVKQVHFVRTVNVGDVVTGVSHRGDQVSVARFREIGCTHIDIAELDIPDDWITVVPQQLSDELLDAFVRCPAHADEGYHETTTVVKV